MNIGMSPQTKTPTKMEILKTFYFCPAANFGTDPFPFSIFRRFLGGLASPREGPASPRGGPASPREGPANQNGPRILQNRVEVERNALNHPKWLPDGSQDLFAGKAA